MANCQSVSFNSEGYRIAGNLFLPDAQRSVPLVVVCHGAGGWKEDFKQLCEVLAGAGYAALAIDMRGHGQSEGPPWYLDMCQWSQDISAAIDFADSRPEIDSHRIAVWGFSSGGTAMYEAALRDSRIKVLVGLDATISSQGIPWSAKLVLGCLHLFGQLKKMLTGRDLRLDIRSAIQAGKVISDPELNRACLNDPKTLEPYYDYPFPGGSQGWLIDTYRRIHLIRQPTLILWGEADELDSVASAHHTYQLLRCEKRLKIIPENGHMGYRDINRSDVFKLTLAWLDTHL
jgi:uncharacterized protein